MAVSFLAAIGIGTVLLLLPISTVSGHISFIDAFFTSTSAVCVTGLIVQDTSVFFSPFGQIVIMILFQLGGLGIMTFSTIVLLAAGKKISIKDRIIIQRGFHFSSPKNISTLVRNIFLYSFLLEAIGALFLFFYWRETIPVGKNIFQSVFHSISAFCNAGFSTFSNNFENYSGDIYINSVLIILIILGGLGFLVLLEGKDFISSILMKKRFRMSLHSKIVLIVTFFLIVFSLAVFLLLEWNHSLQEYSISGKIIAGLFQVITPRTAGFNTMNLSNIGLASVFFFMFLMFVGAAPGSTGGGIKVSTIGVFFAFLKSKIGARKSVHIFKRTLPPNLIMKSFTLLLLAVLVVFGSAFILFICHPEFGMKNILFEVCSAFGTVGLSLGITSKFGVIGKIVLITTMYIGRIGPITLLYALSRKSSFGRYEYVEETIMIG